MNSNRTRRYRERKKQGWDSGRKQRLECTVGPENVNMVAGEREQAI